VATTGTKSPYSTLRCPHVEDDKPRKFSPIQYIHFMQKRKPGRPTTWSPARGETLASLVASGLSIEEAAKTVGIHPATVYRWQNRYADFRGAMVAAGRTRFGVLHPPESYRRPRVPWRKDCPVCGAAVEVRTTWGFLKFWTCERWPLCCFSSWRPPALMDCPRCGDVLFWSHSRKSVGCDACGHRELT
jgi:hypothetical protein